MSTSQNHSRHISSHEVMASGMLDQLEAVLHQRLSEAPLLPSLHRRLADVQRSRGELDAAIQSIEKAISLTPADQSLRRDLAALSGYHLQDPEVEAGTSPPPVALYSNALPVELYSALLNAARTDEAAYTESGLGIDRRIDLSMRRTFHKAIGDELKKRYLTFLQIRIGEIAERLGIDLEPDVGLTARFTVSRDGSFFRPHQDHLLGSRQITIMLYLLDNKSTFTGGDLAVFDTDPVSKAASALFTLYRIQPNMMVAFPSWAMHEVQRVELAGDIFAEARFAIVSHVGWRVKDASDARAVQR